MSWTLKPLTREHISAAAALFNQSVADGEMIFSPLDEAVFERRFFQPGAHAFAAEENGELIGFIHGACKTAFLNKENNENTPGYLSVVVVRKDKRRQGVGSALVAALEDAFRAAGKHKAACNDSTPVHMNWTIPGTPGHDHNNAPGVDERCEGYPFLLHRGYQAAFTEIAMYLDLSKFQWDPALDAKITALDAEGIPGGPVGRLTAARSTTGSATTWAASTGGTCWIPSWKRGRKMSPTPTRPSGRTAAALPAAPPADCHHRRAHRGLHRPCGSAKKRPGLVYRHLLRPGLRRPRHRLRPVQPAHAGVRGRGREVQHPFHRRDQLRPEDLQPRRVPHRGPLCGADQGAVIHPSFLFGTASAAPRRRGGSPSFSVLFRPFPRREKDAIIFSARAFPHPGRFSSIHQGGFLK